MTMEEPDMRFMPTRWSRILWLAVLCAVFAVSQGVAQTPPAADAPHAAVTAPDPATADFLATLSGGQSKAPADLTPAPSFMAGCTSSAQCLPGQRCCPACGQPDCGMACFVTINGRCPLFV
jgi:hypothetical protein